MTTPPDSDNGSGGNGLPLYPLPGKSGPPSPNPDAVNFGRRLDPAIIADLEEMLKVDQRLPRALAALEIPPRIGKLWMQRGRENPDSIYGEFRRRVNRARRVWVNDRIQSVIDATGTQVEQTDTRVDGPAGVTNTTKTVSKPGSWQAAAWLLEHADQKGFGKKSAIEHKGEVDLVHVLTQMRVDRKDPLLEGGGESEA